MFLSSFEGSQTTKQGSKRASGKTMEAERLFKTPNPTDKKAVHSLPCSVRGALLVLSTCCCCPRGCGCPQAILAGVVSVAPVHTHALACCTSS